ncbi:hypothetical protein H9P43_008804 [Blastocladiella emersonii ATCC 22665]|nr:hypothetical protein H9P43_008804 [Blastocladiella emersonii ATCC 22665]
MTEELEEFKLVVMILDYGTTTGTRSLPPAHPRPCLSTLRRASITNHSTQQQQHIDLDSTDLFSFLVDLTSQMQVAARFESVGVFRNPNDKD